MQLEYLNKKNAKDFIPLNNTQGTEGGTTQDSVRVDLVKRLSRDVELKAWFQTEQWKAPFFKQGKQTNNTGAFQVTWYPGLRTTAK